VEPGTLSGHSGRYSHTMKKSTPGYMRRIENVKLTLSVEAVSRLALTCYFKFPLIGFPSGMDGIRV